MLDFRSIEVFFWVVKLGGFGRAAERLRMTQPAISSRISQLETRFGVRLLDRSSHRAPVPTPQGLELFAYAERLLSLQSDLEMRFAANAGLSGTVRLGAAETLVHTMLGALVRQLNQLYPSVTPEIIVDTSPNLQAALLAGELDVALILGPVNEPRVQNISLRDYHLVWVASPRLDFGPEPLGLDELVRWPILSYARGTLPHVWITGLFNRWELPPVRIFANSSLSSIVRLAVEGIGIGVLPVEVMERELTEGQLRRLQVAPVLPPLRFTASYVPAAHNGLAKAVAELANTIAQGSIPPLETSSPRQASAPRYRPDRELFPESPAPDLAG